MCSRTWGERRQKVEEKSVSRSSAILWIMYFQYILVKFLIFYPDPGHHLLYTHRASIQSEYDSQFRLRTIGSYWFCCYLSPRSFFFVSLTSSLLFFHSSNRLLSVSRPPVVFYLSVIIQKANVLSSHTDVPK